MELGLSVGDGEAHLLGLFKDADSLAGRHSRGDGDGEFLGHQQRVQVLFVLGEEGLEAVGRKELGLLVGTETNVGLGTGAPSESSSLGRVDTLLQSPARTRDTGVSVGVVSLERLSVLLDDLGLGDSSSHYNVSFHSTRFPWVFHVKPSLGLRGVSTLTFADGGKDFQLEAFFVHSESARRWQRAWG